MDDNTNPFATKPASKGITTQHFVKFMNELIDIMNKNGVVKGSYIVMDNASIHKSQPMIREIKSKGYRVMYIPPCLLELNPIEQFWAKVKGKFVQNH